VFSQSIKAKSTTKTIPTIDKTETWRRKIIDQTNMNGKKDRQKYWRK
jgi:hypothetical protein